MKIKTRKYELQPNGKIVITETESEVTSPQIERMQSMAEQRSSEVVIGLTHKESGYVKHESERYLSDC